MDSAETRLRASSATSEKMDFYNEMVDANGGVERITRDTKTG
jgi:hypothetical protein